MSDTCGFTEYLAWTRVGGLDANKVNHSMELMASKVIPQLRGHRARPVASRDVMDFAFSPEEEAFREEVRSFLKAELTGAPFGDRRQNWDYYQGFLRKLAAKGWLTMAWPKEWGGMGASHMMQLVFNEEVARARRARHVPWRRPRRPDHHALRHRRAESSASCRRSCALRRSGARASANPAPAPTWRRCRRARRRMATTSSSTAAKSGRASRTPRSG